MQIENVSELWINRPQEVKNGYLQKCTLFLLTSVCASNT